MVNDQNIKCLAVIPARKGSKRFPRKNLIEFHGRRMFEYPLMAAKDSGLFDAIHFSTDDEEAFDIARDHGIANQSMRSVELRDYVVTVRQIVAQTLKEYEQQGQAFDYVCVIYATTPMIEPSDLKESFELLRKEKLDSVCAGIQCGKSPLSNFLQLGKRKYRRLFEDHPNKGKGTFFNDCGAFYWSSVDSFKAKESTIGERHAFYIIPSWKAVDLDYPEDLDMLEYFWQKHHQTV